MAETIDEPFSNAPFSDEPFSWECRNDHFDARWTCPGCYTDLNETGPADVACPCCNRRLRLSVEYFPRCVARVVEGCGDDEEDDDAA